MFQEKAKIARREIIGVIIDLLIHGLSENDILAILSFNKSDISCIDDKYDMTEKICINIARDIHIYNISIEELEKATGVNKAVFKDFVKETK